jgi:hypothetical protein
MSARVASTIAGYWAVTPSGGWILENQNTAWNGADGVAARWRYPWSAAFVSWVMCEGGLGTADRFRRAVAHHVYIDQAIRARDQQTSRAAFVAYEPGEASIAPGDLLCTARRPAYRTIGERRRQMGAGARTHCDIVVKVDVEVGHVLAIGGNVRGSVSLKILPVVTAPRAAGATPVTRPAPGGRPMFAHLKLRGAAAGADVFDASPSLRALGCAAPAALLARRAEPCAVALDD